MCPLSAGSEAPPAGALAAISFRPASADDLEFVIDCIVAAERSGQPRSLYERLFDLDETGLRALLREVCAEDLGGSELSVSSFLLATEEGRAIAGIARWVEAGDGPPSHLVRGTLLSHALGPRWAAAVPRLRLVGQVDIPRAEGALQIESVHIAPSHRGRRVAAALIERALDEAGSALSQILSLIDNTASARAFTAAGYREARRAESASPEVKMLLGSSGRILWQRGG